MELKQTAAASNNDNDNNDSNYSSLPPYDELAAKFVAAETKRIREKKKQEKNSS